MPGVHALGQVAHVDLAKETTADTVRDALNFHLKPAPDRRAGAEAVGEDFHARFSANGAALPLPHPQPPRAAGAGPRPGLARRRALDAAAMHAAAQALVGHHDFTTFRATLCQAKSPVKTLDRLDVRRAGEEIEIDAPRRAPSCTTRCATWSAR